MTVTVYGLSTEYCLKRKPKESLLRAAAVVVVDCGGCLVAVEVEAYITKLRF
jgi:hypothetical protein